MSLKIYDVQIDNLRDATQEDIDLLMKRCAEQWKEITLLRNVVRTMEEHTGIKNYVVTDKAPA